MDSKNTGNSQKHQDFIRNKIKELGVVDQNTIELIELIVQRDKQGMDLYKTTMREKNWDVKRWLQEALEENIDKSRYLLEAIHRHE